MEFRSDDWKDLVKRCPSVEVAYVESVLEASNLSLLYTKKVEIEYLILATGKRYEEVINELKNLEKNGLIDENTSEKIKRGIKEYKQRKLGPIWARMNFMYDVAHTYGLDETPKDAALRRVFIKKSIEVEEILNSLKPRWGNFEDEVNREFEWRGIAQIIRKCNGNEDR